VDKASFYSILLSTEYNPVRMTEVELAVITNGRAVEVLVNVHGPFIAGRGGDLSYYAAPASGILKPGMEHVCG
jgi:rare lipoprotein A (peptidoglycan hydrolase)